MWFLFDHGCIFHVCSVLSGYGRDCLDNELDMELDDEEEMDGFTEDRWDRFSPNVPPQFAILRSYNWMSLPIGVYWKDAQDFNRQFTSDNPCFSEVILQERLIYIFLLFSQVPQGSLRLNFPRWHASAKEYLGFPSSHSSSHHTFLFSGCCAIIQSHVPSLDKCMFEAFSSGSESYREVVDIFKKHPR